MPYTRLEIVIGNSYLKKNPYKFKGEELGYEINLENTSLPVWLTAWNENNSLNINIFEPLYYHGGKLDVDAYRIKPTSFSLEGIIRSNDVIEILKYEEFLKSILYEPVNLGGVDPDLTRTQNEPIPAFYIQKCYYTVSNGNLEKYLVLEIRGVCESYSSNYDSLLKFRQKNFSASIRCPKPFWKVINQEE